jgi:hypothetical protein
LAITNKNNNGTLDMVDKKMRDGKMIPDESYKQGWLEIFGKKKNKKENKKKDEQENKTSDIK